MILTKQQKLYLLIGIISGLLAAILIVVNLQQQRQEALQQARRLAQQIQASQTLVLVAGRDIPAGTPLDPSLIESAIISRSEKDPAAITSFGALIGAVAATNIARGEQITSSKIIKKNTGKGLSSPLKAAKEQLYDSLATATPIGKRAVPIPVDSISSISGMIKPGDYVDILAYLSIPGRDLEGKQIAQQAMIPLFQNVLVLATGTKLTATDESGRYEKGGGAEVPNMITVALTPQEANLLAFVQEQGKLRLVLRSPADGQVQPMQIAGWDTLFQHIMSQMPASYQEEKKPEAQQKEKQATQEEAPPKQPTIAEQTRYVEIYRGLNREKVPLKD